MLICINKQVKKLSKYLLLRKKYWNWSYLCALTENIPDKLNLNVVIAYRFWEFRDSSLHCIYGGDQVR